MGLVDGFRAPRPLSDDGARGAAPSWTETRSLKGGAAPEFGAFYDAHVDSVWRLLERLGVAASVVDDATQDVFLIAHRRMGEFRGDSSLRTWLTGIALRVAKDYRRSLSRRGGEPRPIEEARHLEAASGRPDEQAMANEALRQVICLTEQLEEPQRLVFTLVEFEGFSVPEVAQLTGINANTLSTRLRAARARFNQLVDLHPGELR
jgi:RNA polymerase sigma-70 factor, ECF subfamily